MLVWPSQSAADLLDACDWIVVLRDGRYVHSGAAETLTAGIADPAKARQRFEEAVLALLGAACAASRHSGWQPPKPGTSCRDLSQSAMARPAADWFNCATSPSRQRSTRRKASCSESYSQAL